MMLVKPSLPIGDISEAKFHVGQTVQPWGQYGKWGKAGKIIGVCRACFTWSNPHCPRENTAIQYALDTDEERTSFWESEVTLIPSEQSQETT